MSKNGLGFRFSETLPTDDELSRMFNAVPVMNRFMFTDRVLAAAGVVVQRRARELCPRSKKSDTDKRSRRQRESANWDIPLWKTIKRVFRKYATGYGIVVIGPEWPQGNKAYAFTSPKGRRVWLWGKDSGKTKAAVRNFLVQAFDETKDKQLNAMVNEMKRLTETMLKEMVR